jgi:hypothetical protein
LNICDNASISSVISLESRLSNSYNLLNLYVRYLFAPLKFLFCTPKILPLGVKFNNTKYFVRKLVKGGSAHSFGIHVAKMAGMPQTVIQKAQKLLKKLEKNHSGDELAGIKSMKDDMQLSIFNMDDPLLEEIKAEIVGLDINTLTPVEALMKLNEIRKMITKK